MGSLDGTRTASKAVRQLEDLAAILDALPQPVLVFDREGTLRRTNAAARTAFGMDPTGLDATGFAALFQGFDPRRRDGSFIPPEDWPARRALRGEVVRKEFATFRNAQGERLAFESSGIPLRDGAEVIGAVAVWNDLSYRIRFEQGLRESEKRYRTLVDMSPDGILVHCRGRIHFANPAAARMLGADCPDSLVDLRVEDRVHPDSRDSLLTAAKRTQPGPAGASFEETLLRLDGTSLEAEVSAREIDYHGKAAILVLFRDVAERRKAEQDRERQLASLEVLLRISSELLGSTNPEDLLQRVTVASRELTGARLAVAGHGVAGNLFRVVAASQAGKDATRPPQVSKTGFQVSTTGVFADLLRMLDSIRLTDEELRVRAADWGLPETHVPLRGLLGARLAGPDGLGNGVLLVSDRQDGGSFTAEDESLLRQLAAITSLALKNIESRTAAVDQRLRLEAVMQALPVGLLVADERGAIVRGNQMIRTIWAGPEPQHDAFAQWAGGKAWFLETGEPVRADQWGLSRAVHGGETVLGQTLEIERLDGTRGFVLLNSAPIRNASDDVVGGVTAVLDTTKQIRAEAQLKALNETLEQRVAERTAQLRALASELTQAEQQERRRLAHVLHDHVQQFLVAAKLHVGVLRTHLSEGFLQESAEQADILLREALDTSRSLTVELSPPILHESGLAAGLEWLARSMLDKHGLEVDLSLPMNGEAEPEAEGTRIFLYEAARELLFNVVKHAGVPRARLRLARLNGDAEISVEDDGRGFDPGASLPDRLETAGFGLFSIQQRIESLGGSIRVEAAVGQGSRIAIRLPVDQRQGSRTDNPLPRTNGHGEDVPPPGPAACDWAAGPKIRVLLADDHRIVRQGLAFLLRGQPDIEVVGEAADGLMAIDVTRATHPDVVVMDISMPRLNGIEATRRILAEFPDIRVVGLSMHDEEDLSAAMRQIGAAAYVAKGGPSEDLLVAIRGCARH